MSKRIPELRVPARPVTESVERQADIALYESYFNTKISEHRHNQVRLRCWISMGEINTRK